MDRHDVSDTVTAKMIAELHLADIKIQDQYNCKGLTYWFDDVRKTAFCLIEAPEKQCIIDMHDNAHGEIPHQIIEVEPSIVESFLGRIEDPSKSQNTALNIINEPAFRTLVNIKTNQTIDDLTIKSFNGRRIKHKESNILVSFKSVTSAIDFSIYLTNSTLKDEFYKIGISAGVPVETGNEFFEKTFKMSNWLTYVMAKNIVITADVSDLYKSENQNTFKHLNLIFVMNETQEQFLSQLMKFLDKSWTNPEITTTHFYKELQYSKSKFYRTLKELTGYSLNSFLKDFRLSIAFSELKSTNKTVSEIAFRNGFNSPSYFSKCFIKKYGKHPSSYVK